uniref:Kelch like family member 30 n=1 Tax=Sinocyclocheilus grahami TaxID=75366 RepID=A0A672SWB8_SINGR
MVRNIDDLDFCLSSHPQSILEGLRSLCSQPKLVDVTLSAGGQDFPCHRGILALCSHYFRSMLSGDFVESIAARVEFHDVDPNVLSSLLDFAYTGKLTINKNNVEGLICTSSQLQFHTIRTVCSRYLQHQIDATNCLGILEFGEIHGCPEIVAKAWSFLLENFEAVQQHEEFLMLEKDRLVREYVEKSDKSLLYRNFLNIMFCTTNYYYIFFLQKREMKGGESEQRVTQNALNLQEVLFVMGGRSLDDSDDEDENENENEDEDRDRRLHPRNCGFYNPKLGQWFQLPDFPNYNKWGYSVVSLNNNVYVTGEPNSFHKILSYFSSSTDSWCIICSPFIPKYLSSSCSVSMDGVIYLVADNTKKVYLYNPGGNMWGKIQFLHTLHENGDLVVLGGQLYVTGGHWKGMEGDYGVEVEVYNRASNTWKVECFLPRLWTYSGCCSIFLDTSQWTEFFLDYT